MTQHRIIDTPDAPKAIGPYSQAIESTPGHMLFLSGQIPLDPLTGSMVNDSVASETHRVLANIEAVLTAGGMDRWDVAKTTIYLTDMADFGTVNEIYGEFFGHHRPARATVQVSALPRGARVEIDAVAVRG
jgi:2-iminobutanoate/2-iminopropanoate deaminase